MRFVSQTSRQTKGIQEMLNNFPQKDLGEYEINLNWKPDKIYVIPTLGKNL